jgi:hypothetical protein
MVVELHNLDHKRSSLLKNPSTPLPSTLQGLKNPAIAVFLELMPKCLDAVLDYRLVL